MALPGDRVVEVSKAAQEVAKTGGKAIDAGREFGGFIAEYIRGPLAEGIGIFEDRLKYLRWERQQRLMMRSIAFLANLGLSGPSKPVPLKIALPLFQAASIEEDDYLQDRWVGLLVNAGNDKSHIEIQRSYISILEQLTALDVKILETIYANPFDAIRIHGVVTDSLPAFARPATEADYGKVQSEPRPEIQLSLANLSRVGCLKLVFLMSGGDIYNPVLPTVLGQAFVSACQSQTVSNSGWRDPHPALDWATVAHPELRG
jgi:hypothetical protein